MTRRALQRLAAGLWTASGALLLVRAALLLAEHGAEHEPWAWALALTLGLGLGAAKGCFLLLRASRRNLRRLAALPEPARWWQAFPWYLYPMIGGMIALGFLLRHLAAAGAAGASLPGGYLTVAGVYAGIGAALAASSAVYWRAPRPGDDPHDRG